MEDPNTPIVCRACKRTVPMREISFDETRKAYVCKTCFDSSHRKISEQVKSAPSAEPTTIKDLKQKMIRYTCPDCKYQFQRVEGKQVRECPYCSSKKIEKASDAAVNKLIEESEGWD